MFGAIGDVIGSVGGFLSQGLAPGGFLRGNGGGGGNAPSWNNSGGGLPSWKDSTSYSYSKPFFTPSFSWGQKG